ncbi:FliM/FliN family flagellar motor switch protein [Paracoccus yeei]|uniref:FliM/FliN family flagellar motor C-terminal domain-containing protein n=1 Tax=Paracoccus yeei TaxID=147645 RepID=UPI0028D71C2E|nr:FliM/FliN family flagellar motor switch protein [Paracoccus yeei]
MDSAEREQAVTEGAQAGQVLRRMIALGEQGRAPLRQSAASLQAAQEVSLERAAGVALGRAAERAHRLPVYVESVQYDTISVSELAELLPERALLGVIEGGRDLLGVMALCPSFLAALIEMQALGRLTARAPAPRRPTRTDAAISADFINGLLAELGREFAARADAPPFGHYRYATYLDDPRPLALMLEDTQMTRLSIRFRMGSGGQRDGHILLAVPAPQRPGGATRMLAASPEPVPPAPLPESTLPAPTLADAVLQAPVPVVGVLCRRTLTLRALQALAPGSLIPLPAHALDEARIETATGQLLATGRLGEAEGFHAIRLRTGAARSAGTPPAPGAEPPLADLAEPDPFRPESVSAAPPRQAAH